jgi:hypothetical protein
MLPGSARAPDALERERVGLPALGLAALDLNVLGAPALELDSPVASSVGSASLPGTTQLSARATLGCRRTGALVLYSLHGEEPGSGYYPRRGAGVSLLRYPQKGAGVRLSSTERGRCQAIIHGEGPVSGYGGSTAFAGGRRYCKPGLCVNSKQSLSLLQAGHQEQGTARRTRYYLRYCRQGTRQTAEHSLSSAHLGEVDEKVLWRQTCMPARWVMWASGKDERVADIWPSL